MRKETNEPKTIYLMNNLMITFVVLGVAQNYIRTFNIATKSIRVFA